MAAEAVKVEPVDSEQDEEEDVYEVERIIDMRVEEGEVLYRVRWKNYCSDDDTWEPEAHLEDCCEVLLAFKRSMAEIKAKKDAEAKKSLKTLPTKSDSDSEGDQERPTEAPVKKKKKKKSREVEEEPPVKEKKKKKKKKDKRKEEFRPLPAPDTEEEEEEEEEEDGGEEEEKATIPTSPPKEKKDCKKRLGDSEDEDDEPVPSKKYKREKGREVGKHRKEKEEEGRKRKGKKERKVETSEDEAAAPLDDTLSDAPSESLPDDAALKSAEKSRSEDPRSKQKKGKWEVKLQGIKDLIQDKKGKKLDGVQKESSLQKLKILASKVKEDAAPHSDSSDSSAVLKKAKGKGLEGKGQEGAAAAPPPPPKVPSSSTSSTSSSSSVAAGGLRPKEEEAAAKEEALGPKDASGSTNLFEMFLLNCEAKDRAPRRAHQAPPEKISGKPTKVLGKIEKISKMTKESPAQRAEPEKTEKNKQSDASRAGQSHGFSLDSEEREGEEPAAKVKPAEDPRERSWERKTPAEERRKRREDSEPRLHMACEDNLDGQEPPGGADKSDKGQATLSLGMDLNLDWMTLDDFQKHLNGEDEILSGPPLSPSELRDAVKSGDYMAVKLALNSKEDYNLDQECVYKDPKMAPVERLAYDADFKLQAIRHAVEHGNRAAAREFNINESMVRKWRKQEEDLRRAKKTTQSFRGNKARWPQLEDKIEQWVIEQSAAGRSVSTVCIRLKATAIARDMNINDFPGGPSWCFRFMKRRNLSIRTRTTASQQLPKDYEGKLVIFRAYSKNKITEKKIRP